MNTGLFDRVYKLQGIPVTIKTTEKTLSVSEMASLMRESLTIQKAIVQHKAIMQDQTIMQEAIMRVMASFMQKEATTDSFFQEGEITVTWLQISCAYKNVFNHMKYFMPFKLLLWNFMLYSPRKHYDANFHGITSSRPMKTNNWVLYMALYCFFLFWKLRERY